MFKISILSLFVSFFGAVQSQTFATRRDDSTRIINGENTTHSLNFQLFGPLFLSSIGYGWENAFKNKMTLQFEAKIMGHTNIGLSASSFPRSYYIGSSLCQSLLIGDKFKFKLGISEGIAFNPPSIRGDYMNLNYWDRPPRMVYFVSFFSGCEIKLNDIFYLVPDGILTLGTLTRVNDSAPIEEKYTFRGFFPSFGLTLKLKL